MKFVACVCLSLILLSCDNKKTVKESPVYGLWQDSRFGPRKPYSIMFIDKYGEGVKLTMRDYNGDGAEGKTTTFSGTIEKGIITIDDELFGSKKVVVNNDKLLIGGNEFYKVAAWDELNDPASTKDFAKNIVKIYQKRHPEIFMRVFWRDDNVTAFFKSCSQVNQALKMSDGEINTFDAISETRYPSLKYENLKFVSYQTRSNDEEAKQAGICLDKFDESGQLQITCDLDGDAFFIWVWFYAKTKEGKYILLTFPQISNSGKPLEDLMSRSMEEWKKKFE